MEEKSQIVKNTLLPELEKRREYRVYIEGRLGTVWFQHWCQDIGRNAQYVDPPVRVLAFTGRGKSTKYWILYRLFIPPPPQH